jgi:hypothetical protein
VAPPFRLWTTCHEISIEPQIAVSDIRLPRIRRCRLLQPRIFSTPFSQNASTLPIDETMIAVTRTGCRPSALTSFAKCWSFAALCAETVPSAS